MPDIFPAVLPPFPTQENYTYAELVGGYPVIHDSAAVLDDGRVIYQYGTTTQLFQAYYTDVDAFGIADNTEVTTPYAVDEQFATDVYRPHSTLFRMAADGGLYMSIIAEFAGDRSARIYKSTSGTGESAPGTSDWVLQSTIFTNGGMDGSWANAASIGRPVAIGSRWVLSLSRGLRFLGENIFHQSIYTSENEAAGPWTLRHDTGYYVFNEAYGYGQCRQIADLGGTLVWGSTGNIDPAQCATSTDGLTWSVFTVGGNSAVADPLFAKDGVLYRLYSNFSGGSGGDVQTDAHAYIAETADATSAILSGDLGLKLIPMLPTGTGALYNEQYAVERADPGEWHFIYRGRILCTYDEPPEPCFGPPPTPLHIPFKDRLHELARDFTDAGIRRAIDRQFENFKVIEAWAYAWMTFAGSPDSCQLFIPHKEHSTLPWPDSAPQSFANWKEIQRWAYSILHGECGCQCPDSTPPPPRCALFVPFQNALASITDPTDLDALRGVASEEFDNFKTLERWANQFAAGDCGCIQTPV